MTLFYKLITRYNVEHIFPYMQISISLPLLHFSVYEYCEEVLTEVHQLSNFNLHKKKNKVEENKLKIQKCQMMILNVSKLLPNK